MDFLTTLFGGGTLSQADFEAALKEHSEIKLVNLADGNYVSKSKYEDDLRAKDTNIQTLTSTISERDKALGELKKQLENAGTDAEQLKELQNKLTTLEQKAETDKANYETALKKEVTKGACKDFASNYKFTSAAAKREFVNFLIAKDPELSDGKLIGANDLYEQYKAENEDSFLKEEDPEPPTPPAPPIDRRQPNPPAPKISLTERMKMANAKK